LLRGTDVVFVAFDLTKRASFDNLEYWINNMGRSFEVAGGGVDPIYMIVGTKSDRTVERVVSSVDVEAFLKEKFGMAAMPAYFEISAATGRNLEKLFLAAANKISERALAEAELPPPPPIA
jgi:GTPase SAR1 family protein